MLLQGSSLQGKNSPPQKYRVFLGHKCNFKLLYYMMKETHFYTFFFIIFENIYASNQLAVTCDPVNLRNIFFGAMLFNSFTVHGGTLRFCHTVYTDLLIFKNCNSRSTVTPIILPWNTLIRHLFSCRNMSKMNKQRCEFVWYDMCDPIPLLLWSSIW